MPTDRTPVTTDDVLYIPATYANETFMNLTERAMTHFDLDKQEVMEMVDLSVENIQVRGCMCHHDASDWDMYFVMRLNHPVKKVGEEAKLIAEITNDAWSAGNYPSGQWAKCAQELLDRGLDADEAEAFLRSKHMRWCYDNAEDPCHATVIDFREYLDSGRNIRQSLKAEAREMME